MSTATVFDDAFVFIDDVGEAGGCCEANGFCSVLAFAAVVGVANAV